MTRKRRATREDWVAALMSMLDAGRDPSKISILDLGQRLSVTTGSFYNHFPGGRAELDAALISQWKRERIAALPDTSVGAVHDPLDRLRMIRTAMASPIRASTVRSGRVSKLRQSKTPMFDAPRAWSVEDDRSVGHCSLPLPATAGKYRPDHHRPGKR